MENATSSADFFGVDVQSEYVGQYSYAERAILAGGMILIAVVGSVGNGLVILSVALSRKLRTATNVYVVSLSTTDLLTCLCLPWHALGALSMTGWPMAEWICMAVGAMSIIFVGTSIITLSCIAVNRLYLITKPCSEYRKLYTRKMLIGTTLIAWLLPIVSVSLPPLVGIGELGYDVKYLRCGPIQAPGTNTLTSPYDLVVSVVLFPVPLVLIVVSYVKIFLYIKRHTKSIMAPSEHSSSSNPKSPVLTNGGQTKQHSLPVLTPQISTRRRLSKRQVEITKNLFYVVCAFVVCLSPYSVGLLIPGADHFTAYTGVLLLLNSCVNPGIYAAKHPHFRTVFCSIVTLRFSKIPEPSSLLKLALSNRDEYSR